MFELEIEDNTSLVEKELEDAIKRALTMCGVEAQRHARENLTKNGSVVTGNLRNSIAYEVNIDEVEIGTNVEYASFVEFGTRRMNAKPYLEPAVADHADTYRKIIEEELKG